MKDWRKGNDADRGMNGNAPLAKGFMKEDTTTLDECVQGIEAAIPKLAPTACPGLLGDLAKLSAQVQMRMAGPHAQTEEPEEQLLNIEGIAKYLQVPVHTARQLAKTKDFPALQFGKHIRAELDALKVWARKHLKIEVDSSVYETYNKECDGRLDPQENQKKNGTHPGPTRQEVGGRRQYGRAVGAG